MNIGTELHKLGHRGIQERHREELERIKQMRAIPSIETVLREHADRVLALFQIHYTKEACHAQTVNIVIPATEKIWKTMIKSLQEILNAHGADKKLLSPFDIHSLVGLPSDIRDSQP